MKETGAFVTLLEEFAFDLLAKEYFFRRFQIENQITTRPIPKQACFVDMTNNLNQVFGK